MKSIWLVLLSVAVVVGAAEPVSNLTWKPLSPLPDREGFSGSYAGVSAGTLLVAGGANFPNGRPWEGGTKLWHDTIFALSAPSASWQSAGRLPKPAGYGVSLTSEEGMLMIGGSNAREHFVDVSLARWDGKTVSFKNLPELPRPLAMMTGALVHRTIYIAGGITRPDATEAEHLFLALDLDDLKAGWRELDPWPGAGRILATAGELDGDFYLFGGARLFPDADGKPQREWLRDAHRYRPGQGWKRIADLPRPSVGAPSPAPTSPGRELLLVGGDDGTQVLTLPAQHRGFPRTILAYHPATNTWTDTGEIPFSLVVTPTVEWQGSWIIPGGESHPGIRSTAVWSGTPNAKGK